MTPQSPARRMLLIGAVAVTAGALAGPAATQLLQLWHEYGPTVCRPRLSADNRPIPDPSFVCQQLFHRPSLPYLITLLFTILTMLVACYWAVRWAVRPIRDLVPGIAAVGPQNLGHRINPGRRRDEMAALARAIDEMMDRIATGYEAQRRFAANASHELRTPLAVQRTLIEVGMARASTPDMVALLTAQLLETNQRNERLIEGLLVLSETDRGLLSRTPLRLDLIVASVLADHEGRAAEADVKVTARLQPRVVIGEQVLLERLVTNLIQNAIKYNRPGGTVDVDVREQPALTMVNTGDDVPPEAVSGLFEPFKRLSGARTDHSGGAGLGLAIARSITQAHGGIIAAHSSGRDGLRLEVSFPLPPT